jgi:hypothetical protein
MNLIVGLKYPASDLIKGDPGKKDGYQEADSKDLDVDRNRDGPPPETGQCPAKRFTKLCQRDRRL